MFDETIGSAVGVWEFDSIVDGIHAADAIAKGSPIATFFTGTTHPGRYVILVGGDTASVVVARDIVEDLDLVCLDTCFLPDIAAEVLAVVTGPDAPADARWDAIGVVETATVSSGIDAADAAVKAADVTLDALRLADGIGGKAYLVVSGTVGDAQAAVEAAIERADSRIVSSVVIAQLTEDLRVDLASASRFLDRVRSRGTEAP